MTCFIAQLILLISGMPGVSDQLKATLYYAKQQVTFADGVQGRNYVYATQVCQNNLTGLPAGAWRCHNEAVRPAFARISFATTVFAGITPVLFVLGGSQNEQGELVGAFVLFSFVTMVLSCLLAGNAANVHTHLGQTALGSPEGASVTAVKGMSANAIAALVFELLGAAGPWVCMFLFLQGENLGFWGNKDRKEQIKRARNVPPAADSSRGRRLRREQEEDEQRRREELDFRQFARKTTRSEDEESGIGLAVLPSSEHEIHEVPPPPIHEAYEAPPPPYQESSSSRSPV